MSIKVLKYDSVFDAIETTPDIVEELNQYFTFTVPNHQYMRKKRWDGKAYLFKKAGKKLPHRLYCGLRRRLYDFAQERNIPIEFKFSTLSIPFSGADALAYTESLNLPVEVRDYQLYAFNKAIRNWRQLIICPTGSGKSLIIYLILRFLKAKRSLIIVPTLNLIQQMAHDFKCYGLDPSKYIHTIYSGQEKVTDKPIIVSTWQSLYNLPKEWFSDIECVICDEVHLANAKSIRTIMENLTNTEYRFGTTGTLDDLPVHRLQLEGLFGPVIKPTTTSELIEKDTLSDLEIKVHVLSYSDDTNKAVSKMDYQEEVDFLINHERRNAYIEELALQSNGNTIILFRLISHGKEIYRRLQYCNRPVYLIHGGIESEEREQIRRIVEGHANAIVVASYGTCSTGINIPSLCYLIFASPYKSKIKVLQSIGRILRRVEGKLATLYDIADNLMWKKKPNITLTHLASRIKYYKEEKLPYELFQVELEGNGQKSIS